MMILVLALLAILPFLPALNGGRVWDDRFIEDNEHVTRISRDPWSRTWAYQWGQGWRYSPRYLTDRTWVWTFLLARIDPKTLHSSKRWAWHSGNLLLHALNVVWFYWLLTAIAISQTSAMLAAAVFAVHPLQAMSVAYLSGRAGMLAAFFILSELLLILDGRPAALALAILAGVLAWKSKESGIAALPLGLALWTAHHYGVI